MDKMTLDKIWERYSIENEYTDLKDINKEINGLTVQPLVAEPYSTVFGKCMKLSTPKARWFLSYSGFFVKIESSAHNKNCTNYVKIFYKSPDEDLDFRNYCHMISPQMMSLAFSFSTIISKNVRHRPCSSMKERQACERKCLLKKVKEKITCSLPFMVNSSLPRCEIKSEAIKNRDEYTSIILHTDPIRDCACLKRCVQDIFTPFSKAVWEYNTPIDQIFVRILHKYKEFIRENYSFTFVKLLCDIGSNLGVVVGMSVMSFMSDISQYINYQQVKQ